MAADKTNSSDSVKILSQRVEGLALSKANKEFVVSEFNYVKSKLSDIEKDYYHIEGRVDEGHKCFNQGLIEQVQRNVESNAQSIKKLYTWQASVGISLLVFFLTIGIAALRYVDNMDHSVQENSKSLEKLQEHEEDLLQLLKDALKR